MIIITDYELVHNKKKQLFLVVSRERSVCPICGGPLKVKDSRHQHKRDRYGKKTDYMVRRLYCSKCRKLHTELPDCIYPHKWYDSETIESVIDGEKKTCCACLSTINRWINWFRSIRQQIEGILISMIVRGIGKPVNLLSKLSLLKNIRRKGCGWLKLIAVWIVSSGNQIPT